MLMDENETFRAVCKEIFGQDIGLSLEEGEKVFAQGILLPPKRKTISGETVYTNYDAGKYVDFKNIEMSIREDTLMRKTAEIKSLEDLERFYRQVCGSELAPVLETLGYLRRETSVWMAR